VGLFNSQYAVWVHQFVCPNVSLVQLLLNRLTYTDETGHCFSIRPEEVHKGGQS